MRMDIGMIFHLPAGVWRQHLPDFPGAAQIEIDLLCGPPSLRDRLDNIDRPENDISAGKYALTTGLERSVFNLNGPVLVPGKSPRIQDTGCLPDRRHDRVHDNRMLAPGHEPRGCSSASVFLPQFHPLQPELERLSVLLNPQRRSE